MGEQKHQRNRRRHGSGEDRISGLPDALLHEILVRLRSADAAARTSLLSRRWRHVWEHMPELRFVAPQAAAPAEFPGTVDAALGGYLAPTLEHFGVSHSTEQQGRDLRIPAGRIAPWLHFAAEHVVGEINLYLCVPQTFVGPEVVGEEAVLELPVCERAKRIELLLQYACTTWLRPQASGLFKALTSLKIDRYVSMDGSDLSALVSTQCPCLRDLDLFVTLIVIFDVFIHSNSLHTLKLHVLETRRLEVVAPILEELTIFIRPMESHITAPKLERVAWLDAYDPQLNQFGGVGRRLQKLETSSQASSLTKQFDEVDELDLSIYLRFPDVASYRSSLNETNKLPKCKSFCIFLSWEHHALLPVMLHLLSSCNGTTKKFRVHFCGPSTRQVTHSCPSSCACRSEESRRIDGIDLSSLEVVEISGFSGSVEEMEVVKFLSSNAGVLKRLLINDEYCRRPKQVREKVRSMCHPNVKVEFFVFREGKPVLVD